MSSSAPTLPRTEAGKLYKRQLRDEYIGDAETQLSMKEHDVATDRPPDSLKVDEELEKEFQTALQHELTDDDIERAKLLLGVDTAQPAARAVLGRHRRTRSATGRSASATTTRSTPTRTTGRQHGGDRRSPTARWSATSRRRCSATRSRTRSRRRPKSVFRGIHVFVSGGTWDWYRPLLPG